NYPDSSRRFLLSNHITEPGGLFIRLRVDGQPQSSSQVQQFSLQGHGIRPAARRFADVPARPVDPFQERLESDPEGLVIMRTPQSAFRPKLHVFYAADRTRQARQFIRRLADVLADQRLENAGQIQLLLLEALLLLRARLAQVEFLFVAVDDVGQVNGG